ncbi:amino acid permease [Komagataeibacter medellinensis]|uniref:amino acid permease n=1 Tax=Komagataeibacter medellinensis TaxID=1177712 RepID=UPI001E51F38B|nr:amino acid permease [Komagataeibacter medellinensis]
MNVPTRHGLAHALLRRLPANAPADNAGLKRVLGLGSLIALAWGPRSGRTVLAYRHCRGQQRGPAVIISFALAAVACAFAGLCYGELAGMIPTAGSAYVYAYAALGELAGWVIGWTWCWNTL